MRLGIAVVLAALVAALGAGVASAATVGREGLPSEYAYVFRGAKNPEVAKSGGETLFTDWGGTVSPASSECRLAVPGSSLIVACPQNPGLRVHVLPLAGANEIYLFWSPHRAVVHASDGDDVVVGTGYYDEIYGGPGADEVAANEGDDWIEGGSDTDVLAGGHGNDRLDGGAGPDTLAGEAGTRDYVDYRARTSRIEATLDGTRNDGEVNEGDWIQADVEGITSGAGPDLLEGDAGPNELNGRAGNDELEGGPGVDHLWGDAGNDEIRSRDGESDHVACGPDWDKVIADPIDVLEPGCELRDIGSTPEVRFLDPPQTFTECDCRLGFRIVLSSPSSQPVTVDWTVQEFEAMPPDDYTWTQGTYTFPAWETVGEFTISAHDDYVDEADEAFQILLTGGTNVVIAETMQQVTIVDDDAEPSLSVDDPSASEGNGVMSFTVSLSAPSGMHVSVDYMTQESGKYPDYEFIAGTLTFAPGETQQQVDVVVYDDTLPEANETFDLVLSSPVNASLAKGTGTGTIVDDDFPELSIHDVSVAESPSGQSVASFTVTLSQTSGRWINFGYLTVDGTATAGSDYRMFPRGSESFAPGELVLQLHAVVYDDTVDENDETFEVVLDDIDGAVVGDGSGVGTIVDDDPSPLVSISDVTLQEGDTGVKNFPFMISLSAASERTVTVQYTTSDDSATSPGDYTPASGTLKFAPGERTKTVNVGVTGDTTVELNEDFYLTYVQVKNADEGTSGRGKILNDD